MDRPKMKPQAVKIANEEQAAWHSYLDQLKKEEPKRLEEAAKFLSGMISLSLTIFLSSDKGIFQDQSPMLLASNVVLWLISLLLAFLVLFPMAYRLNKASSESIEDMHKQAVRRKTYLLAGAVLTFVAALGILVFVYIRALGLG